MDNNTTKQKMLDKAVCLLKDAYKDDDFFCERLIEIPEEAKICKAYCNKDGLLHECIYRYLLHCVKTEEL